MTIDKNFGAKFSKEMGPLTFALFMRVTRNSTGLTQEKFGEKLGLSRANVCDIEKGRYLVSPETAIRVAKKAGFSEKMALQACLQDQIDKTGFNAKVAVS